MAGNPPSDQSMKQRSAVGGVGKERRYLVGFDDPYFLFVAEKKPKGTYSPFVRLDPQNGFTVPFGFPLAPPTKGYQLPKEHEPPTCLESHSRAHRPLAGPRRDLQSARALGLPGRLF